MHSGERDSSVPSTIYAGSGAGDDSLTCDQDGSGQRAAEQVQPQGGSRMSRKGVEDWLVSELARRTGVEPQRIDVEAPFAAYGIDSAEGAAMVGELEAALGMRLSEALLWEYPSVAALAEHLVHAMTAPGVRRPPAGG